MITCLVTIYFSEEANCFLLFENVIPQADRWDSRKNIIPLLHTLMYAIIQVQWCHSVEILLMRQRRSQRVRFQRAEQVVFLIYVSSAC